MTDLISRQAAIDAIKDLPNCPNGYSDTYDKARIIGVLEDLPSTHQWIPVTERLPEHDGRYLVTWLYLNKKSVTTAWHGKAWWRENDEPRFYASEGEFGNILLRNVTAWMPLPEPYEGEEDV